VYPKFHSLYKIKIVYSLIDDFIVWQVFVFLDDVRCSLCLAVVFFFENAVLTLFDRGCLLLHGKCRVVACAGRASSWVSRC
jgi:uncharacterized membrane protein